jgi:hypothetical protein
MLSLIEEARNDTHRCLYDALQSSRLGLTLAAKRYAHSAKMFRSQRLRIQQNGTCYDCGDELTRTSYRVAGELNVETICPTCL